MKKNQLFISALSLLIAGIGSASATNLFEGDLQAAQQGLQTTSIASRGAEGPIRSVDVQPATEDLYASLSKYHAAQQFDQISSERGAQGPIRSDSDMAMDNSRKEWKKLVGPFDGYTD